MLTSIHTALVIIDEYPLADSVALRMLVGPFVLLMVLAAWARYR